MEDARADDAAVLGVAAPAQQAPATFDVWEEHWPALHLFLSLRTQWRVIAGMSGAHHQGLDYTALYGHPAFARLDYDDQEERIQQVGHIEAGALEGINAD